MPTEEHIIPSEKNNTPIQWLESNYVDKGEIDGYPYYVVEIPPVITKEVLDTLKGDMPTIFDSLMEGNLCNSVYNGYIVFPKRPVKEAGMMGIISYVQVHGGISYAEAEPDGSMVYGFDTRHAYSPLIKSVDFIVDEIRHMLAGILKAAELEPIYLSEGITEEHKKAAVNAVITTRPNASVETSSIFMMLNRLGGIL